MQGNLNLTGLNPSVWALTWNASNPFYFIALTGPQATFNLCPGGTAPYLDTWGASGTGTFGFSVGGSSLALWSPTDFRNGGGNFPAIRVCGLHRIVLHCCTR